MHGLDEKAEFDQVINFFGAQSRLLKKQLGTHIQRNNVFCFV